MPDNDTFRTDDPSTHSRRNYLRIIGATTTGLTALGVSSRLGTAAPSTSGTGQSGAVESGPESPDAFFVEDFETGDYTRRFRGHIHGYHGVTNDHAHSGSSSLEVAIPSDSHRGISGIIDPNESGYSDIDHQELYAEYWLRFDPHFDGGRYGSKLPGFCNLQGEGDGGAGGDQTTGYNDWSARGMYTERENGIGVGFYVYHMDMDGPYGDHFVAETVPRDEWVKIGQYAKLNTVSSGDANPDGELKMWVNDELVLEKGGFRFTLKPGGGINQWIVVYHGSSYTPPSDQSIYFDDIMLAPGKDAAGPTGSLVGADRVVINGTATDTPSAYEFTVSGEVEKDQTTVTDREITDTISGQTASGVVEAGGKDIYYFTGDVTDRSVDGDAEFRVELDEQDDGTNTTFSPRHSDDSGHSHDNDHSHDHEHSHDHAHSHESGSE